MKAKNKENKFDLLLKKWDGDRTCYDLTPYHAILKRIKQEGILLSDKPESELVDMAKNIKKMICNNPDLDNHLSQVYALVEEIIKRKLKIFPYDVQLIGAIALHEGNIIEMQTGEGKTLTAVFAAILNALTGKGVHVLTFNDYLAKRDADWMRTVYGCFDLTVSHVDGNMSQKQKKDAYSADITYATAKEVGFDYLRSNMAYSNDEMVLEGFNYAIVDEADALMIDEARNPLVLAGDMEKAYMDPYEIAKFVENFKMNRDYRLNEYQTDLYLTEIGIEKVERQFDLSNLFEEGNQSLHASINLALQASVLLNRDIDYVVKENSIKLVDELTGRIVEDRKWQNGLHTAVEAKEGLPIQTEGTVLSSISIQHLMRLYPKLSGMTGTARDATEEFDNFYDLGVVVVPPNRPFCRIDFEDAVFADKAGKYNAIVEEIKKVHSSGRPILIGTLSIKESEQLQKELQKHQLYCELLNAKNDAYEAQLISKAGKLGAITISTNMAGRGTDILLGGGDPAERLKVVALGGLHIVGTNRHESIRIDQQLRGRAGRQGDPGSSRFIISLEDDLMIKYKLRELLPKKYRQTGGRGRLEHPVYARTIAQAQRIIAAQMFEIRKTLLHYSTFVEQQRKFTLAKRKGIFLGTEEKRECILNLWDLFWTNHLNFTIQLRSGIYWERVGGNDPLRVFFQKADQQFCEKVKETEAKILILKSNKVPPPIKRPSSTWTYIVNDNPFQNKIGIFLSSSGNIGFQIDLLVGPVMFLTKLVKRFIKRWFGQKQ
ncbi:DEAD/DEAH box helicase [Belliella marina]|uniref:Protein translocase subunit SecA n=1 Tax=Belliella marina TaxID=1644146 RepID=A0ABW4VP28_9BACT